MAPLMHRGVKVNLIHGEEEQSVTFKALAQARFPMVRFHIPRWERGAGVGSPAGGTGQGGSPPNWPRRCAQLSSRLAQLAERLSVPGSGMAPEDATALLKALKAANQAASLGEAA